MGAEAIDRREGQTALQPADRVKILVVDDQAENLLAAEAVLESLGQEVVRAQSGREALRRLLADDFAVILLDVMMPMMDGFETASLIRQRERSRTTPIIFITALGRSEEHIFRGYDVGAVDYLTKPVVPEILRSKVAVFVDGCFWHGHNCGKNVTPKTNASAWRQKITRNKARDLRSTRQLRRLGWRVVRIWECQLAKNAMRCVARISRLLCQ